MGINLDILRFIKTIRKKSYTEMILCSFLLVLISAYYCVDVFHILPYMYRLSSTWYLMHALPLTFVVFNLLTNFMAVIYADSSVIGRMLTLSEFTSKGICNTNKKPFSNDIILIKKK